MNIIVHQSEITRTILGQQPIKENCRYRQIKFLKILPCEDGLLVYNVLTAEFAVIYSDEIPTFNCEVDPTTTEIGKKLINLWYLVTEDTNDAELCKRFADTMLLINRSRIGVPISSFTILPTTDCNARCFYCFELAGKRKWMSEQTAHDVADFIDKRKASNNIRLRWFGGEPLYNSKAIDIICEDLRNKGISYTSSMVSNGFLFDDDLVVKAKKVWNMRDVQITLDGTEEIYNRTKAFIYKNVNAFKRVTDNIEKLLKQGIQVRVRMNMDDHNEKDLFELTEQLSARFRGYDNFLMYAHLLFEDSCARIAARTNEERQHLIAAQMRLSDKIAQKGHADYVTIKTRTRRSHCMCDNDSSTMILPEGQLGKCQHFTEDHFYGSIYSDEIDINMLNELKDIMIIDEEKCSQCEYLPMCMCLKSCLIIPHRCDEYDKKYKDYYVENNIYYTYKKFKEFKKI